MDKCERVVDLKKNRAYLGRYVALRNSFSSLLLTKPVTVAETKKWLLSANVEIIGLVKGRSLLGAAVLYLDRKGEIAVFVSRRNSGVGSRLLKAIEQAASARKLNTVWAWVLTDNVAALDFFIKNGYRKYTKKGKIYEGSRRCGVVFRKKINAQRQILHTQARYGIRKEAVEFPMMCVLSFVYVCNARCPNCPYTNSSIRSDYSDRPYMDEKTFKIIADQCGKYHAWIRISGGGEPMLHPRAVELFEYAKKTGAKVGLITNGSRFTQESMRRLLAAQVDMIEFSVDAADKKTYGKVRTGLDWGVLVKNVKRMVTLRDSMKSSTKIIASAIKQKGIDIAKVNAFWSAYVDNFQERKYLTWGINDPALSADPAPYLPSEDMVPCPFLFERLNIDSRGKVMVCGLDIAAKTDMGNVHTKSIKEIWHGKKFAYYRKMHLDRKGMQIPICRQCPDWKYRSWQHNYWKIVKNAEQKRAGAQL